MRLVGELITLHSGRILSMSEMKLPTLQRETRSWHTSHISHEGEHKFVRAVFPLFFGIQIQNWHLASKEQKATIIRNGQLGQYKLPLPGTCWD
jgi:hypothetical protein